MIISNLLAFESCLSSSKSLRKHPLFKVLVSLSAPEIILYPTTQEIHKMIFKFVRSIIDSSKLFLRWMNGSCIITPPQKLQDDETITFTFHSDIITNPSIISLVNTISSTVNKSFSEIHKWIDGWRKYRPLWKVDKVVTLEKFALKKPTPVHYDEKLLFYAKLAKDVESQPAVKEIDFVKLCADQLQDSVQNEAKGWLTCIGNLI